MKTMQKMLLALLMSCTALLSYAQQRTVTGKVSDEQGTPISNASYVLKGTQTGGVTTEDGSFSISVSGTKAVLLVTSVGYNAKEVAVGNSTNVSVVLTKVDNQMDAVVVTALGIKRQAKSLGYAVQEVKGETLTGMKETNITNALTGQVAGLQIMKSSSGPAGSAKILLRGFNSLTGDNQPLIVIDGVPMNNFVGQTNSDYWNPSLDMGNGLSDLNAEDVASISVLKGPSAAALYGTRAGNGVILITTKSGRAQKGLGITINSSVGFESSFMIPNMQSSYGQGSNGIFNPGAGASWGPKIDGQQVKNWDSTTSALSSRDNIHNFLQTGIISNQNISFQQTLGKISFYSSYNRVDNTSMIPGAKLTRNNIMTRATAKLGKEEKLSIDAKVQFNNTEANNRPMSGVNDNNVFRLLNLFPRSLSITDFTNPLREGGTMSWYGSGNGINPYWSEKYNLNQDIRNRFMLNGTMKYDFTNWLSGEIRMGSDMYTTNTEAKTYAGSPLTTNGNYSLGKAVFQENNYSTMFTAKKDDLFNKIGGTLMIGGNLMNQESSSLSASASPLEVPNLFAINNAASNPSVSQAYNHKKINSVFGSGQLSYDGYLFIDATFRNDWSSSLSKFNRSFFYPSVSASFVFSDLISKTGSLPSWFSYGKVRAAYSSVGNDMPPYQLYNTYSISKDPNGITNAGANRVFYNDSVRSELIKNVELGAEMRFFKNRFGIDFTYYKSNATNQLIGLPLDPMSGFERRMINAGNIQNKGIELVLNGQIIQNSDGVNWSSTVNMSRSKTKIVDLADNLNVKSYQLGGYDNLKIMAISGSDYGDIYGSNFKRVTDPSSQYYGQLILRADNGLPQVGESNVKLGNQQADMLMGWTNQLRYKNISLSFLIDGRFGGEMFSATNYFMQTSGTAAATVVNGDRSSFVVDGVKEIITDGKVTGYTKNTTTVTPQQYWGSLGGGNLGIQERNMYDATSIRLRNVQLNYKLPNIWVNRIGMQGAQIGVSCNNVWMIKSNMNGVDPESVFSLGTNAIGFENMAPPTSRTFFINLSVNF